MNVTNDGVLVESQEDRFPRGFHSPDEENPKKKKLEPRNKCPKCGSEEIDRTCCRRRDDSMTEKCFCQDCAHIWREVYELKLVEITDEAPLED